MATAKRPRKEPDDKSSSLSNSSGSDDLSYDDDVESSFSVESGLEISVDLQGHSIGMSDVDGVKRLIQSLLPNSQVKVLELAELVASQRDVGSIVKLCALDNEESGDDTEEDVLALATVINLTQHKEIECIKQLKSIILEKSKADKECFSKLSAILSSSSDSVGFLICERFLNIPVHLALPLLQSLHTEVTEACKKNNNFKFGYYLVLARTYMEESGAKRKRKGKGKGVTEKSALMFDYAESEFMHKESLLSFSYPTGEDIGMTGSVNNAYRTVMLIPAERLENILKTLRHEIA